MNIDITFVLVPMVTAGSDRRTKRRADCICGNEASTDNGAIVWRGDKGTGDGGQGR